MTWREVLAEAEGTLLAAGVEDAAFDAKELLLSAAGIDAAHWPLLADEEAAGDLAECFGKLVRRRAAREPLQQILGFAWFYGERFSVGREVLTPRFDTETLVEACLPRLRKGMSVLDLGCGSGCILLSLLLSGPSRLTGVGLDRSSGALEIARENLERYAARIAAGNSRVEFCEADLFHAFQDAPICDKMSFDVIVSNPPYIPTEEIRDLMPEVREYEPHGALDGGEDGLIFYRHIIRYAPRYLADGGVLALECGYDQAEELSDLMTEAGFSRVEAFADLNGVKRAVLGRKDA